MKDEQEYRIEKSRKGFIFSIETHKYINSVSQLILFFRSNYCPNSGKANVHVLLSL